MNSALTALRQFTVGAYLAWVANFYWVRPRDYLCYKVLGPAGLLLFFALFGSHAGRYSTEFYVVGNAMMAAAITGIWGVSATLGNERRNGTLPYLFAAPANRLVVIGGRAFVNVLDGMFGVAVGFTMGVVLLGARLEHTDPWALMLVVLVTAASVSALGLIVGVSVLLSANGNLVNNTAVLLLLLLSGSNVARADLPPLLQFAGQLIPLTRGIEAARRLVAGASLADVTPLVTGELVVGLAYFALGYASFRWTELAARKKGSLEYL